MTISRPTHPRHLLFVAQSESEGQTAYACGIAQMPVQGNREARTHPECSLAHAGTRRLQGREQHVHLLLLREGAAILPTAAGTQGGQSV